MATATPPTRRPVNLAESHQRVRHPLERVRKYIYTYVTVEGLALLFLVALDTWVRETGLTRPHLWLGGVSGLVVMGGFLFWRHPGAIRKPAY